MTKAFYAPLAAIAVALAAPAAAVTLNAGNLIVAVEGRGYDPLGATYAINAAAPLSLAQFAVTGASSATYLNSLVLPQNASGANHAISGEYGSSSEGGLQLTADGKHLVIMGYGVNAAAFNANPTSYGTAVNNPAKPTALGQSGSLQGQGYNAVSRVVAVIGADGSVDTSTALYGVFNGNNPRSVASVDGSAFYISGQGIEGDQTAGVFYATLGSSSAVSITGDDTASVKNGPRNATQDTRMVQIHDGELYVSTDSKGGKDNARSFIGTLADFAGNLPESVANNGNGPTMLSGFGNSGGTGKITTNAQTATNVTVSGKEVNLSPENFFFADDFTLYVADSGAPKNDSADKKTGLGGLQKWILDPQTQVWSLAYTVSAGLNLVGNTSAHGTTGLFGLTGKVGPDGQVQLFATNYTIGDGDASFLYGLTDTLGARTRAAGEAFSLLASAPTNSAFRGLSFAPDAISAPVPEPATYAVMIVGFAFIGGAIRERRRRSLIA